MSLAGGKLLNISRKNEKNHELLSYKKHLFWRHFEEAVAQNIFEFETTVLK